jgi:drug/metabolite transporter (DMT)-like permease
MTRAATPQEQRLAAPEQTHFGAIDVALLMMVIIWGLNAVIVKMTYTQIPPMVFMAVRFAIAGSLLLAVALLVEHSLAIPRRDWLLLVAAAMVGTGIYQPLFLSGLALTTASNTSLIIAASPAFVALLNRLLGREILSARGWLGIALAFAGILLIVESGGGLHLDSQTLVGDLLIFLGTILWASYTVLSGPLVQRYSPLRVTALTTSIGALPLMFIGAPAVQSMDWSQVDWRGWSGLLYSAIFAIVISYVIWNIGVKKIGGARTSLYSNLIPVVGTIAAAILLGETITPLKVVGAAVIFMGLQMARTARVTGDR